MQASSSKVTDTYRQRCTGLDEMLDAERGLRPAWQLTAAHMDHVGLSELHRRQREIERRLREDGATYHVYGSPEGPYHPWNLDAVPMLIDPPQWHTLARGLQQRAHLFALLMEDVYGDQRALSEGLIPPQVIFDHPGFLRPLVGSPPPSPHCLPVYAADLGRDTDGALRLLCDRTQAPSGLGYVLENRRVMAETQAGLYRDLHVQGLGDFLSALQACLDDLAEKTHGREGGIGLLTPGPFNETFFDQALLASYLGIPLLQGSDLNAAGGRLRMPQGDSLRVLLRRVDAEWCDPLELRPDSLLGVPGLTELARQQRLCLANPMGSGVLENFGLMPFLPTLAQTWLGETLTLPQTDTWWCGQSDALDYVLKHLDELVVRPIARSLGGPIQPETLGRKERETLVARIRRRPALWAGQARVRHSTAPFLAQNGLEPHPIGLRTFAAATHAGFAVLPGALIRRSGELGDIDFHSAHASPSKDLWVPTEATVPHTPWLHSRRHARALPIPPHTADNLFWSGRYLARAEWLARSLHAWGWRLEGGEDSKALRRRLLTALALLGDLPVPKNDNRQGGLLNECADALNGQMERLSTCLAMVRERLPADALTLVKRLRQYAREDGKTTLEGLEPRLTAVWALEGILGETLVAHDGGAFFVCGLRIERALGLTTLARTLLRDANDQNTTSSALAEAGLASTGGTQIHARSLGWPPDAESTLDLLLRDTGFARSVAYQLHVLEQAASDLPGLPIATQINWPARVRKLATPLASARPAGLSDGPLQTLSGSLRRLSDELTTHYFPLAPKRRFHGVL